MSFNTSYTNPSAVWQMEWCEKIGDRENREAIPVEIVGAISKGTQQPIQNLRVSVRGTMIKTTVPKNYRIGQELFFLNRWWQIDDVIIDVSEYAPQSAAFVGNELNNAVYSLQIIGSEVFNK